MKLKVGIIIPPIAGHKNRGTGVYADKLYQSLKEKKAVEVKLVNHGDNLNKFDLIHYPYFDPFFLTLPLIQNQPTVVTVHDLIPLKFPQFFPLGLRGSFKWQMQKLSLKEALAIITDSHASKEDIMKFTGISREKIFVIYLGVGEEFRVISSKDTLNRVRAKLKLPENFILHVGDVNYNKNIGGLIKAFNIVKNTYPNLNLVLIGNGFVTPSPQLSGILDLISSLKLGEYIFRLRHVNLGDLVCVYNLAKVYLQPSFAEGFGLPVLEAMACGIPVVVSNSSSLPEIVGNAGLLVDPHNVEQIASSISAVHTNPKKREELIKKGLARAKQFSWEKCAEETVDIYKKIVN